MLAKNRGFGGEVNTTDTIDKKSCKEKGEGRARGRFRYQSKVEVCSFTLYWGNQASITERKRERDSKKLQLESNPDRGK